MVVVIYEPTDLSFEVAGQIVVFEQDAVFERLMPTLDLALGFADGRGGHARAPYCARPAIRPAPPRCRKGHCLRAIGGDGRLLPDQPPRLAAPGPAFV